MDDKRLNEAYEKAKPICQRCTLNFTGSPLAEICRECEMERRKLHYDHYHPL